MQKNIFKKIISFSFLILFLISFVLPIYTKAQLLNLNPNNPTSQPLICFSTQYDPNDTTSSIMIFPTGRWYFKVSPSDVSLKKYNGPFDDQAACQKGLRDRYYYETITPTDESNEKTKLDYYPLAPLPGVGETCEKDVNKRTICVKTDPASGGFAKYLNVMIQIFIGLAAVLSMIMIVMGGIEYMTSELVSTKQAGKDRIRNAVLGLILALGSYAILNTLNPDLLDVSLSNVREVEVTIEGSAHMEQVIQDLPNNKTFKKSKDYETIKTLVGSKYNHCIVQAIMQIEGGNRKSQTIGHDENVTRIKTNSRKPFIDSGVKFSGTPFTKGSNVQNDDIKGYESLDPNDINLSLDTRFSHSIGSFGATFFTNKNNSECSKPGKHSILCLVLTDGSTLTPKEMYNNTNNANINWAINFAKKGLDKCKDPLKVFYFWAASGGCVATGNLAYDQVALQKKSLYDQCVAQDK